MEYVAVHVVLSGPDGCIGCISSILTFEVNRELDTSVSTLKVALVTEFGGQSIITPETSYT